MNKVNILLFSLCLTLFPILSNAKKSADGGGAGSHHVKGHFKKDGTYVQPHQSTNPNQTQRDNWTSKPNVNPYTGKPGTKEPQK
jgi:hypothetical protein